MSVNKNPDSITPAVGEFSSKVPPSEPLTTKGHAPGVKVGNDLKPEFHLETHPPGTAPEDRSFEPQTQNEIPGQASNPDMQGGTSVSETLPGATSADVHQGYGHPGEGMTSQELHGGKRKRVGAGLEGVGANASDPIREQGLDVDHEKGHNTDTDWALAEEREPVTAEELASELKA
ncbi:hypothetical protein EDB81DRAFT_889883 [Dactylonectria macrodidyma]|uniref:Uncharacterized protein n=1 Tax=Dactylonectria macrodidyma TaxID=307937 RepID=A0A9P9IL05_9HYPO|nr:hypothetical protein EDB81DRAFT_889883 [Dactylonectria macrodidyma]